MDPLTMIEIVGGALGIACLIGGILMKAYISPIQGDVDDLKEADQDKENRLRKVESRTMEHEVHISTLITTSEKLLGKMDELMSTLTTVLLNRTSV